MKLREFYENNNLDYDAFLRRLMGKERLAEKYIKIFLADRTYAELAKMVADKDYEQSGKKAHTLKGIALNLDLKTLSGLCVKIINSVHSGNVQAIDEHFSRLKAEYEAIVSELEKCIGDLEKRP